VQGDYLQQVEDRTENVKSDAEAANKQLHKGIGAARRARKMKWCLFILLIVIAIVATLIGLKVSGKI
jgi:t-SNARE complex subunit (syntaxin)